MRMSFIIMLNKSFQPFVNSFCNFCAQINKSEIWTLIPWTPRFYSDNLRFPIFCENFLFFKFVLSFKCLATSEGNGFGCILLLFYFFKFDPSHSMTSRLGVQEGGTVGVNEWMNEWMFISLWQSTIIMRNTLMIKEAQYSTQYHLTVSNFVFK